MLFAASSISRTGSASERRIGFDVENVTLPPTLGAIV
jgi:hypothetical protein